MQTKGRWLVAVQPSLGQQQEQQRQRFTQPAGNWLALTQSLWDMPRESAPR
jgi:hypothetical protein